MLNLGWCAGAVAGEAVQGELAAMPGVDGGGNGDPVLEPDGLVAR